MHPPTALLALALALASELALAASPGRNRVARLADDLRLALSGVLAKRGENERPRQLVLAAQQRPYCVPAGQSTSPASTTQAGPTSSSATAASTHTSSSASGSPTTTATTSPTSSPTASPTPTRTSTATTSTRAPTPSPAWTIVEEFAGDSFFSKWNFDTIDDLNGGYVTYLDEATARSSGIVSTNSAGNAVLRVDTTPQISGKRNSHRLTSRLVLDNGLIVFDAVHMPTGCGTWPAFWTVNADWPKNGEIDIVEGVNDYTTNQYTLHTAPGCTLQPASFTGTALSSLPQSCAVAETGGTGCPIRDASPKSYGAGFNAAGGGAYAMRWAEDGIAMWFWPRGALPSDIEDGGEPRPEGWGEPAAMFGAGGCAPFEYFAKQSVILDTALCGTLTNALWAVAGSAPGQEESCAARTGYASCEQYVREKGEAFREAYWEIKSVRVYQYKP